MKRTYLVVFEKAAEDNWGGWTLDVPGAVGAGNSLDDARKSLMEGIDIQLEDIVVQQGKPAPPAISMNVDFSEFDPDPATSHYVVEWLAVELPQAVSQTQDNAQQAA